MTAPAGKILLVGPYPPPIGGVSTHVRRLSDALIQRGFGVEVVNHYGPNEDPVVVDNVNKRAVLYWWRLRGRSADVVHFHYSRRVFHLLAVAAAHRANKSGAWMITIHGHALRPALRAPGPVRAAIRRALYSFDMVVAVSDEVAQWLREFAPGIEVEVTPAYIPPAASELPQPDPDLARFIGTGPGMLVVSAYRIRRYGRGDLYGLDVALDLLKQLRGEGHDVRLAVFLARAPWERWGRRYWQAFLDRAREPQLADHVLVRVDQDLLPALRPGVIYLRPTRTDGDAISIREALDLGVPVLASDVVGRPPGVRTLPVDDLPAWVDAVAGQLQRPPTAAGSRPDNSTVDRVIALYDRLSPRERCVDHPVADPEPIR